MQTASFRTAPDKNIKVEKLGSPRVKARPSKSKKLRLGIRDKKIADLKKGVRNKP